MIAVEWPDAPPSRSSVTDPTPPSAVRKNRPSGSARRRARIASSRSRCRSSPERSTTMWRSTKADRNPTAHAGTGHDQRILRHTNTVERPKHGRSANATSARSFTVTGPPHPPHVGRGPRDSIETTRPSSSSATSSTFTSGRPTNSSHMRVASDDTGAPRPRDVRHLQIRRAPVPRPGPSVPHPTPLIREAPVTGYYITLIRAGPLGALSI